MTSIHTNTAAMAVSSRLNWIAAGLDRTQSNVSSGLRVGSAADNAAYWSISTTMKSDNKALSAVSDAIGFTSAVLDTAYAGLRSVVEEFSAIRNLMIQASQTPDPDATGLRDEPDPNYDKSQQAKIADEVKQHLAQIRTTVESASFGGVNLLYVGDNSPVKASETVNSFVMGYAQGKVITKDLVLTDTLLINDSYSDGDPGDNNDPDAGLFDNGIWVPLQEDTNNGAFSVFPLFNISGAWSGTAPETTRPLEDYDLI
jgi:flagellin